MKKLTPLAVVDLAIPALIGATVGITLHHVAIGGWDLLCWLSAAFMAIVFFIGNVMSSSST